MALTDSNIDITIQAIIPKIKRAALDFIFQKYYFEI